jgi:recombination protein RecA
VKNKVAAPFKDVEVDLMHGKGFCRETDLIDLGVAHGIVDKSGSWLSFGGERIGQGRENARQYLSENTATAERIEAALRSTLGLTASSADFAATPAIPAPTNGKAPSNARLTGIA